MDKKAVESEFDQQYMQKSLKKVIDLINHLKDFGLEQYLQLPKICVVGAQSSGKSSVLESIIGQSFLPKGQGIVTRAPIELRLNNIQEGEDSYCIFQNNQKEKIVDLEKITDKILEIQNLIAGREKGVSSESIVLNFYSPDCPDLTLVDLPGIIKVAGKNQAEDTVEQINTMIDKFTDDPRSIILAVTQGNIDIGTSDSLNIQKKFDPQGKRTIGVLTKIDNLSDDGIDIKKTLEGKAYDLKEGFIGIKNRSQTEINQNMSIRDSINQASEWYTITPPFDQIDPKYLGVNSLTVKCSSVFSKLIEDNIPDIRSEINEQIKQTLLDLEPFQNYMEFTDDSEKLRHLKQMIDNFKNFYKETLESPSQTFTGVIDSEIENIGSQIKKKCVDLYRDMLQNQPSEEMTDDEEINAGIRKVNGMRIGTFTPNEVIIHFLKKHMKRLAGPSYQLLQNIANILKDLIKKLIQSVFEFYPDLAREMQRSLFSKLEQIKEKAKVIIDQNISAYSTVYFHYDEHSLNRKRRYYNKEKQFFLKNGYWFNDQAQQLQQNAANVGGGLFAGAPRAQPQAIQAHQVLPGEEDFENKSEAEKVRTVVDNYYSMTLENLKNCIPLNIRYHFIMQSYSMSLDLDPTDFMKHFVQNKNKLLEKKSLEKKLDTLHNCQNYIDNEF